MSAFRAVVLAAALLCAESSVWAADRIVECSLTEQWDMVPDGLEKRATPERLVFSFDTISGRIVRIADADAIDIRPADFMTVEGKGDWVETWVIVPAQVRKSSTDAALAAVAYAPIFRLWPVIEKGNVVMGLSLSGPGSVGAGHCMRSASSGKESR